MTNPEHMGATATQVRRDIATALDGHTRGSRDCHLSGDYLAAQIWPLVESFAVPPLVGVQRPEDVARAARVIIANWINTGRITGPVKEFWANDITAFANEIAVAVLALPHTGQPQEGWEAELIERCARIAEVHADKVKDVNADRYWQSCRIAGAIRALSAAPASPRAEGEKPLAEFARWAISEGPFEGCHLDGSDIQDKAEKLGLLIKTKYDPAVHGESAEAEPGDDWFVFAPAIIAEKREQS